MSYSTNVQSVNYLLSFLQSTEMPIAESMSKIDLKQKHREITHFCTKISSALSRLKQDLAARAEANSGFEQMKTNYLKHHAKLPESEIALQLYSTCFRTLYDLQPAFFACIDEMEVERMSEILLEIKQVLNSCSFEIDWFDDPSYVLSAIAPIELGAQLLQQGLSELYLWINEQST